MWIALWSLAAFSPSELTNAPLPQNFDATAAKPKGVTWREWCDPPFEDDMDVPLSNRSLRLQRDTAWLQMRAATLDTLEFAAPHAAPLLWQRGSSLLDVGAASGEITRFIARKYGMKAMALDVATPENNSYARYKQRSDAWPVRVFDGATLPAASASYDVVLFVFSLHHAGRAAPALLREAARVARSTIVVVEACDVLEEATDAEARRLASETRAREFACMGDRKAIFRSQREWTALLEQESAAATAAELSGKGGQWRVARVGAVRELASSSSMGSASDGPERSSAGQAADAAAAAALAPPTGVSEYRRFFVVQRQPPLPSPTGAPSSGGAHDPTPRSRGELRS